ncbi:aldo/keto reductase [Actinocorallia sp. API 0066]|uniref:aldo/keto reductase n=1 Tax=Actinocorallia sp. API 0066 TaxID=2896846 RepID=UPI001E2C6B64|nr:aldo/keto reductase [Actinocorallia sp. API 0066]MCD0449543.1 aldo/keto reductase [Actinocorallia sp. API 0066]
MRTVDLGSQGFEVSAQGLGCMGMSQSYGVADDTVSLATIDRALELGVTFFDTADVYGLAGIYGFGANEKLLGYALRDRRDEAVIATKFGIRDITTEGGRIQIHPDGSPEYVRRACESSLRRLRTDRIDLYYLHRPDPKTPIEDTIGAMAELVAEGKVRYLGVSEVSAAELERAHAVHPITALQSEYSLWTRGIEDEILPTARRLGVGVVPFSPLGRGFLTGTVTGTTELSSDDMRHNIPRFTPEALDANQALVATVRDIAAAHGALPGQVALAWVHAQGDDLVPIPGTKRPTYLEQNAAATTLTLTPEDLTRLNPLATQVTGSRY